MTPTRSLFTLKVKKILQRMLIDQKKYIYKFYILASILNSDVTTKSSSCIIWIRIFLTHIIGR